MSPRVWTFLLSFREGDHGKSNESPRQIDGTRASSGLNFLLNIFVLSLWDVRQAIGFKERRRPRRPHALIQGIVFKERGWPRRTHTHTHGQQNFSLDQKKGLRYFSGAKIYGVSSCWESWSPFFISRETKTRTRRFSWNDPVDLFFISREKRSPFFTVVILISRERERERERRPLFPRNRL